MTEVCPDQSIAPFAAPGAVPLKRIKYEIYAQQRALACPPEQAAQRAGFAPRSGRWGKLERNAEIRARIAWLRREDDELIVRKREWIEEELRTVVEFDLMAFALFNERGHFAGIDMAKLQASSLSKAVNELTFDKDTGKLTKFKRDDRLNALAQLRDMHGFRAPSKSEVSGPDGGPVPSLNVNVTDEQRVAALMTILHKAESNGEQT